MPTGGGVGAGPFHSQSNEAWFAHTAGLKVVYPSTAADAKGLLIAAINDPNPVMYFEHKALDRSISGPVPEACYEVEIGKARLVTTGEDISIITYGAMVWTAIEAADKLALEGISVEVVDLRTLVPLDEKTLLDSVKKTSKAIVLHEATMTGGFGGEIASRIAERAFEYLDGPLVRVAAPDTPVPFSPPLEEAFLPNAAKLLEKARWLYRY